jgi:NADH-quinone oxidoreductase E subunit
MTGQVQQSIPETFDKRLLEIISKYPSSLSAIMPALYLAQEHYGFISDEAIQWVAEKLDVAPVKVMEIATFYTMYYKHKVGKYHVQVCRTLSCHVRGAQKLTKIMKERFDLKAHEVSKDGIWSFEEVECLGSCGTAPMCQINDRYFENLDEKKFEELLDAIASSDPNLSLSVSKDTIGSGLKNEYGYSSVVDSGNSTS